MSSTEEEIAFQKKLAQKIELWLKEGLITHEQKDNILSRYKLIKEADEKAGTGRLITTITILGSILVGIGIILFVAANWSEIPRWGKLLIIFSSMLIFYGLGFYIRYEKRNYPKVGASLILLGSFVFGAGIFLIAQIYHITVHYPNGPLMWGLGVLPLAYYLRLNTLLSLAIIDLLIWLGMESSLWLSAYRFLSVFLPFITLYFMAGIALWMIGLTHSRIKSLETISRPYIMIGILVTFLSEYILTFDVFRGRLGSDSLFWFYMSMVGLFLISALTYLFSREKEKGWLAEIISLSVLMALIVALSIFYENGHDVGVSIEVKMLVSNLIFAIGIIGIIFLGYIRRKIIYINIGLLFFVMDVLARYFDFFWKLLPRSIFFIIGGSILLLSGVILEKKRRKILASFNIEEIER